MVSDQIVVPGDILMKCDSSHKSGLCTYISNENIISSTFGKVEIRTTDVSPFKSPGVVPTVGSIVLAKVSGITRRLVRCDIVTVNSTPLAGPFRALIRREDIRATQRDQAEPADCYRPGDLIRARVINMTGPGVVIPMINSNKSQSASSTLLTAQAISSSIGVTGEANAGSTNAVCLLSTAETDLGVVLGIGRSPDSNFVDLLGRTNGFPLIPISWTEMLCPHTLTRYPRKVARVTNEIISQLICNDIQ